MEIDCSAVCGTRKDNNDDVRPLVTLISDGVGVGNHQGLCSALEYYPCKFREPRGLQRLKASATLGRAEALEVLDR